MPNVPVIFAPAHFFPQRMEHHSEEARREAEAEDASMEQLEAAIELLSAAMTLEDAGDIMACLQLYIHGSQMLSNAIHTQVLHGMRTLQPLHPHPHLHSQFYPARTRCHIAKRRNSWHDAHTFGECHTSN